MAIESKLGSTLTKRHFFALLVVGAGATLLLVASFVRRENSSPPGEAPSSGKEHKIIIDGPVSPDIKKKEEERAARKELWKTEEGIKADKDLSTEDKKRLLDAKAKADQRKREQKQEFDSLLERLRAPSSEEQHSDEKQKKDE